MSKKFIENIYLKTSALCSTEPKGIECLFEDDCACGYSMESSNNNDMWVRDNFIDSRNNNDIIPSSNGKIATQ